MKLPFMKQSRQHVSHHMAYKPSVDGKLEAGPRHYFIVEKFSPFLKGKRHLDIGCWEGAFLSLCNNLTKFSVGLELEIIPLKLAILKKRARFFVNGSVLSSPFRNNFFEAVTFSEVVEHLPSRKEIYALQELNRILVSGGYLWVTAPNSNPLGILLDPAYFLRGHRHYTRRTLKKLLYRTGFKTIKIYYTGGPVGALRELGANFYKHILKRPFPIYPWLERLRNKEYFDNRSYFNSYQIQILAQKK